MVTSANQQDSATPEGEMIVVENFFEELKAKLGNDERNDTVF